MENIKHRRTDGPFDPVEYRLVDDACGLRAHVVIDDTSRGPAAGGIRTRRYADDGEALADARALARSMSLKCALADLPAGGGKGVVMVGPGMDRERAFEQLGAFVEHLDGVFLTASDMGTTRNDLVAMARCTSRVYTDEAGLAAAVGRGCVGAMEAAMSFVHAGESGLRDVRIAVQGCGKVGGAVARAAAAEGAELIVADLDEKRAGQLADELGAEIVDAGEILFVDADILSPCADGGVIDETVAAGVRARVVCGAANNILATASAEALLSRRAVVYVPEQIASAGAVIEGVGRMAMARQDCGPLVDRIGETAREVLDEARRSGRPAAAVAADLAVARILAARG